MSDRRQQIDLYQRRFHKTRVELSARLVVQMSLLLALALFATSLYSARHAAGLQRNADNLELQAQKLQKQTYALGQLDSSGKENSTVERIAQLKQNRGTSQRVLNSLRTQNELSNRPFSSYFQGLARRTLDGLWLQDIYISQGGQSIMLAGNTYKADLIPQLIKELKNEPAFQGITFSRATVSEQGSKVGNALGFSLLTHHKTTAPEFK
jgi:hypothetical protein